VERIFGQKTPHHQGRKTGGKDNTCQSVCRGVRLLSISQFGQNERFESLFRGRYTYAFGQDFFPLSKEKNNGTDAFVHRRNPKFGGGNQTVEIFL
jgi:hypothetical protein